MIQNACKNGKPPRMFGLVRVLHHTAPYDTAELAGFYHPVRLREKIGMLKFYHEGGDDED